MSEVIRLSRSSAFSTLNITIMLKKEVWEEEIDGYTLDQPFTSDIRLAGYYSEGGKHAAKMLCMLLKQLVCEKNLKFESVIVVEADPSEGNALVTKVYKPMGFQWRAPSIVEGYCKWSGGALMTATVGAICDSCG